MALGINPNLHTISSDKRTLLYDCKNGDKVIISNDANRLLEELKENNKFDDILNNNLYNTKLKKFVRDLFIRGFLIDQKETNPHLIIDDVDDTEIRDGILITDLRLNLTDDCNLDCKYCYEKVSNNLNKRRYMSWKIAKLAIDQFRDILIENNTKFCRVRFFGGEPLLNWNILKQSVDYIKETFPNDITVNYLINTNGTLITRKNVLFLKENAINVILSIDGLEEFHDENRKFLSGKGSFFLVNQNLDILAKNGCQVNISVVCTDASYPRLQELVWYVAEKKEKYDNDIHISFNNIHISDRKGVINIDYNERVQYLLNAIRQSKIYGVDTSGGLTYMTFNNMLHGGLRHCTGIGNELSINPDGQIFPCAGNELKLGDLEELSQLFESEIYMNLCRRSRGKIAECNNCEIEAYCVGGCYAEYLSDKGKETNTLRDCDLEIMIFKELVKENLL